MHKLPVQALRRWVYKLSGHDHVQRALPCLWRCIAFIRPTDETGAHTPPRTPRCVLAVPRVCSSAGAAVGACGFSAGAGGVGFVHRCWCVAFAGTLGVGWRGDAGAGAASLGAHHGMRSAVARVHAAPVSQTANAFHNAKSVVFFAALKRKQRQGGRAYLVKMSLPSLVVCSRYSTPWCSMATDGWPCSKSALCSMVVVAHAASVLLGCVAGAACCVLCVLGQGWGAVDVAAVMVAWARSQSLNFSDPPCWPMTSLARHVRSAPIYRR